MFHLSCFHLSFFVDFIVCFLFFSCFFFFNDTATTEIYTLSLHDALPICWISRCWRLTSAWTRRPAAALRDRKSTRLNSSHTVISYAVFCLKKKKKKKKEKKTKQNHKTKKIYTTRDNTKELPVYNS